MRVVLVGLRLWQIGNGLVGHRGPPRNVYAIATARRRLSAGDAVHRQTRPTNGRQTGYEPQDEIPCRRRQRDDDRLPRERERPWEARPPLRAALPRWATAVRERRTSAV